MVFPAEQFLTATPESQGVSSKALAEAIESIRQTGKDIHSLLVIRRGYLLSETYFAPYTAATKHSMYSCSKTFTSMLIGIARGKGLLSLDDTVASYFPDKLPDDPSENLMKMTIRNLLCMTTGNDQDTFGYMAESKEDWVKTFLSRPVENEPGTFYRYNTGATYMLSAILTKLTGKTALELAQEWIFPKIGITGAIWDKSPQGISLGGTGLHIRPLDMARFGLLLLSEGQWNGEEVVPAEYVREAQETKIVAYNHIPHPDWTAGYGYQIWRCSFGAYRADGMGGQFIVVMPDQEAVIIFTSALSRDIVYPMDFISEKLVGLFGDSPLPENPEAQAELKAISNLCQKPEAKPVPEEAEAGVPWGKRIKLNGKLLGMVPALTLYRDRLYVESDMGDADLGFRWGAPMLSYYDIPIPEFREPMRLSFMANWDDGLVLRVNALGEPFTARIRFAFSQGKATVSVEQTMGTPSEPLEGTYA